MSAAAPPSPTGEYPHPNKALPRWLQQQKARRVYRGSKRFIDAGDYKSAIAVMDSAIAMDDSEHTWFYNRAVCKNLSGDVGGFLTDLNRTIEMDSTYTAAWAALAAHKENAGQNADDVWDRILELDPNDVRANWARGQRLLQKDQFAEALPYLRRLANETPQDPRVHVNLGLAAAREQKFDEARTHLSRFIAMAPSDRRVPGIKQMLSDMPR